MSIVKICLLCAVSLVKPSGLPSQMVQQFFRLDGKTAFVSGSRGYLGTAMVYALCGAGAHLIVNGRDDEALKDFETDLLNRGYSVERASFDAHDIRAVRDFFGSRARLDILVNNAVTMQAKSFDEVSPEDFASTYSSSVTASFEAIRAALPALKQAVVKGGDASVINIASMYGQIAPDARIYDTPSKQSPFHYGPAKAGLLQLTRHLAAELGRFRIRVNALVPGPFPAPAKASASLVKELATRTMLGRIGKSEEIAGPLLFLASPAASFVTGAALNVDGGWTAW